VSRRRDLPAGLFAPEDIRIWDAAAEASCLLLWEKTSKARQKRRLRLCFSSFGFSMRCRLFSRLITFVRHYILHILITIYILQPYSIGGNLLDLYGGHLCAPDSIVELRPSIYIDCEDWNTYYNSGLSAEHRKLLEHDGEVEPGGEKAPEIDGMNGNPRPPETDAGIKQPTKRKVR